jgi:FOG: WD40-like repeat
VIEREKLELWTAEVSTSTSSPILVDDMIYVVAEKGDLCAVNANTGEIQWKLKLGIEQRNSCPFYADGKLYVPMLDDPARQRQRRKQCGRDERRLLHHQAG